MKYKFIKRGAKYGFTAGAATGGAVLGAMSAMPGARKDGAKEGAIAGAAVGLGAVFAGKVGKVLYRGTKSVLRDSFVFRKIRGRIIPIKIK